MSRAQKSQIQPQAKTQTQPKAQEAKPIKADTGLNREEMEVLKKAFDLFDVEHTGKVDIKEILDALVNCGYDQLNPVLFQIIADLDNQDTIIIVVSAYSCTMFLCNFDSGQTFLPDHCRYSRYSTLKIFLIRAHSPSRISLISWISSSVRCLNLFCILR